MTTKYLIQDKLKYIFSNSHILLNSLKFYKNNNVDNKHLDFINFLLASFSPVGIFQKDLSSLNVLTALLAHLFPITYKSKLCPSCGYKYSMAWSENIQKHILKLNIAMPKECRMFFFTTDPFYLNFLPPLIRYSTSSFIISAGKEREKRKFLNILNITLLNPILSITD